MNVNSALKETSRSVVGSRSLGEQGAARRPSGDLARAARRRGPVPAHAHQPPPRGRRVQPAEPAALPRQPAAEPLRRAEDRPRSTATCSNGSAAVPGVSAVALSAPALLSGSVNSTGIFVHGRTLRDRRPRSRQQHQPPRGLAELLRRHGDPGAVGARLQRSRQRHGAEGGDHQRGGGDEVLPERESGRAAVRVEQSGERRPARDRRRRCATSSTTASAMPAPPTMFVPYMQTRIGNAAVRGADAQRTGGA